MIMSAFCVLGELGYRLEGLGLAHKGFRLHAGSLSLLFYCGNIALCLLDQVIDRLRRFGVKLRGHIHNGNDPQLSAVGLAQKRSPCPLPAELYFEPSVAMTIFFHPMTVLFGTTSTSRWVWPMTRAVTLPIRHALDRDGAPRRAHDDDIAVLGIGQIHDALVGFAFLADRFDRASARSWQCFPLPRWRPRRVS